MITIFTDGSSKGNPGPGGWGTVISRQKTVDGKQEEWVTEIGGAEAHTTNNRMELTAAIKALEFISSVSTDNSLLITVYSDATYVVKGITEWIHGWHRNNWKTAGKKPVENKELWMQLFEATQGKHLTWKLVEGHAGVPANERCDVIATTFADGEKINLYNGPQKQYKISLSPNGSIS
jgi:ribonuclease HI